MFITFKNKSISAILSVIPNNKVTYEEGLKNYNFSRSKSMKLKKIMGFNTRYIANKTTTVSDLSVYGIEYLLKNKILNKKDISGIILVTQTPDYIIPPTSNIIQSRLNLSNDTLCLDINQGCAGYLIGLMICFNILDTKKFKKILLINGDVLSKKVSKFDRNTHPLIGDGAAISVIENKKNSNFFFSLNMDGKNADFLKIQAGGIKTPSNKLTAKLKKDLHGNTRSLENLSMKGDEVYLFIMSIVPSMISKLLKKNRVDIKRIKYFFFHQPNQFILKKLSEKMNISEKIMPNNIVGLFGNSSGATIPINICNNFVKKKNFNDNTVCLAGFGVGLTWASAIINLSSLKYKKIIKYS